ncbi:hypothetical protein Pint_26259 [Pistacia integerrima]|uniref:Uncharacterized protein n=1 Tax=Pistacia integerrima TaxID=434235 RepID=A0ACC0YCX4_9ROSI|nr:hypothetical protein Pint_26259 [Pistacia integerrima]
MLQLSKRLASKGLKVTLVTAESTPISIQGESLTSSIKIEPIPDGFAVDAGVKVRSFDEYIEQNLAKLIKKHEVSGYPVKFIVYDSVIPWMLDVVRGFGLDGAPFFTQAWAVNAIYYHFHQGTLKVPSEGGSLVSLPSMPPLGINDLPSFICDKTGAYPSLLNAVVNQLSNIHEASWILCNTFLKLEDEVC